MTAAVLPTRPTETRSALEVTLGLGRQDPLASTWAVGLLVTAVLSCVYVMDLLFWALIQMPPTCKPPTAAVAPRHRTRVRARDPGRIRAFRVALRRGRIPGLAGRGGGLVARHAVPRDG